MRSEQPPRLAAASMLTEQAIAAGRGTRSGPRVTEWALVGGLVAIFAANALAAVLEPASYRHLLAASPLSRLLGLHRHGWAVILIAVNDGVIATGLVAATLARRGRRWMLATAGAWLAVAAVLKLTACVA
jgi:hypothetical protein